MFACKEYFDIPWISINRAFSLYLEEHSIRKSKLYCIIICVAGAYPGFSLRRGGGRAKRAAYRSVHDRGGACVAEGAAAGVWGLISQGGPGAVPLAGG